MLDLGSLFGMENTNKTTEEKIKRLFNENSLKRKALDTAKRYIKKYKITSNYEVVVLGSYNPELELFRFSEANEVPEEGFSSLQTLAGSLALLTKAVNSVGKQKEVLDYIFGEDDINKIKSLMEVITQKEVTYSALFVEIINPMKVLNMEKLNKYIKITGFNNKLLGLLTNKDEAEKLGLPVTHDMSYAELANVTIENHPKLVNRAPGEIKVFESNSSSNISLDGKTPNDNDIFSGFF